jgi:hypothetical protein
MAPMPQRGPHGASTRSAENSPAMAEFYKSDPEWGPGVVGGDPSEIREKYRQASNKAWPVGHTGGQHVTTTDDTGRLRAPSMTCSRCKAETGILVGPHQYAALCVQCSGSVGVASTLAPGPGDDPLPTGKTRGEPTYALTED